MGSGTGNAANDRSRAATPEVDLSIRLTLPADPEYARVARSAAAGLALRLGFTYGEIEELRLAVDEVLILLLRGEEGDGSVVLTFLPLERGLELDASPQLEEGRAPLAAASDEARSRFEELVSPIVDAWSTDEAGRHVHLVKRVAD